MNSNKSNGPVIARSKNNYEKRDTYNAMINKYYNAIEDGSYLEAIFIVYALLEDRINQFLFHAGIMNLGETYTFCTGAPQELAKFIYKKMGNNPEKVSLTNISTRLNMLKHLIKWAIQPNQDQFIYDQKSYELALKNKLNENSKINELPDLLDKIKDWINVRNECVHGLMNKDLLALEEEIKDMPEKGFKLFRKLDNFEKKFTSNNTLREDFNIS